MFNLGQAPVGEPVGFVDRFTKLVEQVVGAGLPVYERVERLKSIQAARQRIVVAPRGVPPITAGMFPYSRPLAPFAGVGGMLPWVLGGGAALAAVIFLTQRRRRR